MTDATAATPKTPAPLSGVGCFALGFGLLIASLSVWMTITNIFPPPDTQIAEGVVVEIVGIQGARMPVVEFVVDGTRYRARGPTGSASGKGATGVGASATVRYYVAKPSEDAVVLMYGVAGGIFMTIVLTGIGGGLAALGIWLMVRSRRPHARA